MRTLEKQSRFGDLVMVAFVVTQVLDGLLTYRGIREFGVELEGNPLIALAMSALGVRTALFLFKTLATLFGFVIYSHRYYRVLAVMTAVYVVAAIAPWILILYTRLLT